VSYLFPSPTITFDAALRDLAGGSPRARAMAAHALGDVGDDPAQRRRAVEALVRALDDDRLEVRAEAASSLGELGEAGAVPHLIKRLGDGAGPVRQNAAIALGTLRAPDAFDPLATALREGPPDLRFQAATSLAEIEPERGFEPIATALDDTDAQVVAASALAIGAIGRELAALHDRAVAALLPHLDHANAATRFEVAYALAQLGDTTGCVRLAEALDDAELAWDAVDALGWLALRGATPARASLARALALTKLPPEAAVLAAGNVLRFDPSDARARGGLIAALASRKGHVRAAALEQLTEVGGAWALAALDRLSRSGKGRELGDQIAAVRTAVLAKEGA
jgi:HEAT repeat protein